MTTKVKQLTLEDAMGKLFANAVSIHFLPITERRLTCRLQRHGSHYSIELGNFVALNFEAGDDVALGLMDAARRLCGDKWEDH